MFARVRYPRLRLAMEHNHKAFVGHMYCQQMLRQEWHGGVPWLGKGLKYKILYVIYLLVLTPFFIAHWSFTQVGKDIQKLRKSTSSLPASLTDDQNGGIFSGYLKYCAEAKRFTILFLPVGAVIVV